MAKRPTNIRSKIIEAALACAADTRWREISLATLAETAGITLSQLHGQYPSKMAIVAAIMDQTTTTVVAGTDPSANEESPHDRLLDAVLRRFDVMEANKTAITSILKDMPFDPARTLCLVPGFLDSMAWTLESAGISSSGIAGRIRTKGLAAIYLGALGVWMRDDSPDLTKTMAFLDRRLKQAVQLAGYLPFGVVGRISKKQLD
jgi:AcrR family transcriptional regulator